MMLNLSNAPLSLPIACQKVLCMPIYKVKSTDWFKKGPFKKQMV